RFDEDPEARRELEEELRIEQERAQAKLGRFERDELLSAASIRDRIVGLTTNENIQRVDLSKFNLTIDDADTLILKRRGILNIFSKPIQIRLSGVDAPETGAHDDDPLAAVRIFDKQPYGEEASEYLRQRVEEADDLS